MSWDTQQTAKQGVCKLATMRKWGVRLIFSKRRGKDIESERNERETAITKGITGQDTWIDWVKGEREWLELFCVTSSFGRRKRARSTCSFFNAASNEWMLVTVNVKREMKLGSKGSPGTASATTEGKITQQSNQSFPRLRLKSSSSSSSTSSLLC